MTPMSWVVTRARKISCLCCKVKRLARIGYSFPGRPYRPPAHCQPGEINLPGRSAEAHRSALTAPDGFRSQTRLHAGGLENVTSRDWNTRNDGGEKRPICT